jgi:hypothetical protein
VTATNPHPPTGGDEHSPVDGCGRGVFVIRLTHLINSVKIATCVHNAEITKVNAMLNSESPPQSVCIVGDGSLFHEVIEQLVTERTNLLVSSAIYSDDLAFLNPIASRPLDVILVCESGSLNSKHILNSVLASIPVIGLRIVIVRLDAPVIDVYARPTLVEGKLSSRPHRITAKSGNDLINAIWRKRNGQTRSRNRILH